jgi:Ulp1 family protease
MSDPEKHNGNMYLLGFIESYLKFELDAQPDSNLEPIQWQLIVNAGPDQNNGFDCGVCVISTADFLACGFRLTYTSANLEFLRICTFLSVLKNYMV